MYSLVEKVLLDNTLDNNIELSLAVSLVCMDMALTTLMGDVAVPLYRREMNHCLYQV